MLHRGEFLFQRGIKRVIAGYQPRCPCPRAIFRERCLRGGDDRWVIAQAQIIITGEIDVFFAALLHLHRIQTFAHPQGAAQMLGGKRI